MALAAQHADLLEGMLPIDTGARLRVNPTVLENDCRAVESGEALPLDPRIGYAKSTPQSVFDSTEAITADSDPRVTYKDWISDDSFDFMGRAGSILVSSLPICGDEDEFTSLKYHEFLRDRLAHCQLEIIPQAGYWTYTEQLALFDRAVRSYLGHLPQ